MKLGHCHTCDHWLVHKFTTYDDGSTVDQFKAKDGWGLCEKFDRETEAEFGCGFCEASGWDHVTKSHKAGAPWQHWVVKACPDCKLPGNDEIGRGYGCIRCAGTGKVRHYEDGFIGEEQTRLHPKQKELLKAGPPECMFCHKVIDANWVCCPFCGARTNKPGEREVIGFSSDQVLGTTDAMINAARAKRERQEGVQAGETFAPPPMPQPQEGT